MDSWDVGFGASECNDGLPPTPSHLSDRPFPSTVDDGGGVFISWEALSVIRKLGLKPKRSLRAIAWTCEEMGGGARAFWNSEWNDPANYSECSNGRLGL